MRGTFLDSKRCINDNVPSTSLPNTRQQVMSSDQPMMILHSTAAEDIRPLGRSPTAVSWRPMVHPRNDAGNETTRSPTGPPSAALDESFALLPAPINSPIALQVAAPASRYDSETTTPDRLNAAARVSQQLVLDGSFSQLGRSMDGPPVPFNSPVALLSPVDVQVRASSSSRSSTARSPSDGERGRRQAPTHRPPSRQSQQQVYSTPLSRAESFSQQLGKSFGSPPVPFNSPVSAPMADVSPTDTERPTSRPRPPVARPLPQLLVNSQSTPLSRVASMQSLTMPPAPIPSPVAAPTQQPPQYTSEDVIMPLALRNKGGAGFTNDAAPAPRLAAFERRGDVRTPLIRNRLIDQSDVRFFGVGLQSPMRPTDDAHPESQQVAAPIAEVDPKDPVLRSAWTTTRTCTFINNI